MSSAGQQGQPLAALPGEAPPAAASRSIPSSLGWSCPLCEQPRDRVRELYGVTICRKCWASFLNRRQAAFLLDWLLLHALAAGLHRVLPPQRLSEALLVFFPLIFALKDGFAGTSPGKWLLGLQVVDRTTLEPIGVGASIKRNILIALPYIGPLVALLTGLNMSRGPRWGDGWANTQVVWRKHAHRLPFDQRGVTCQRCGYDLTGNVSGICPECGSAVPSPEARGESIRLVCCTSCGRDQLPWQFARLPGVSICLKCMRSLVQRREAAFVIDLALLTVLWLLADSLFDLRIRSFWSAPARLLNLPMVLLFALKDSFLSSPGKAVVGLRVIDERTGRPAGPIASLKRNLLLVWPFPLMVAVDLFVPRWWDTEVFIVVLWAAAGISLVIGTQGLMKFQRVGEKWARTRVIRAGRRPPPRASLDFQVNSPAVQRQDP